MEYVLAFQYWYCEFCMENWWGRGKKHCLDKLFFFGGAWMVDGWGLVWWGRKSYLEAAEIASFSRRDFNLSNKHDTFWYVITTGYFYVLFLWTIAVSDFSFLEIYKNLGFLLPTITFTVNSHVDNHIYKYMFQMLYSLKPVFLLKYTLSFDQGFLYSNLI